MKTMNDFRKYVEREKNKRKGAFFFNFAPDEGLIFQEEVQYLREIYATSFPEKGFVPLNKDVRYPDELTDAQIGCYFTLIPWFRDEECEKKHLHYGNLYLLEMANLLYHEDSADALRGMFHFRDQLHLMADNREYYMNLCDSFLIAHPECAVQMKEYRRARGLLPYRDLWQEIRSGIFDGASIYVKSNARLLKENELSGEKDFSMHAWNAMPDVFYELDARFQGNRSQHGVSFRDIATAGKEERTYLDLLPVKGIQGHSSERIAFGDGLIYLKEKGYGRPDRWYRQTWNLFDSSGDFLYVIYLYTESFMREHMKGPRRARSATRILKKNYRRNNDIPRNIRGMKAMLQDEDFEKAIGKGVAAYLDYHPEVLAGLERVQEEKKRSQTRKRAEDSRRRREEIKEKEKQQIYDMDHEQISASKIDRERLKQVKKEMDSMSGMLHEGKIGYDVYED